MTYNLLGKQCALIPNHNNSQISIYMSCIKKYLSTNSVAFCALIQSMTLTPPPFTSLQLKLITLYLIPGYQPITMIKGWDFSQS